MSVEAICRQVSEASLHPAHIRREDVRRWLLSRDPRVTDRLCVLLVENGSRLQALVFGTFSPKSSRGYWNWFSIPLTIRALTNRCDTCD